jgi:hypothetical protein
VRLEPYTRLRREAYRVDLVRLAGEVGLQLAEGRPLLRLEGAPWAPEDELIGSWKSSADEIVLGSGLRYSRRTRGNATGYFVAEGGQTGRWVLQGDTVRLIPDSPVAERAEFVVERDEAGAITLRGEQGEAFTR